MDGDAWLVETYFDWLKSDCFVANVRHDEYVGVLRLLHDIPFYWTIWSDENRAGDALAFRQSDFLSFQSDLDSLNQQWLAQWATASPSVLEVLLGISRRWCFYFEQPTAYYFGHLFVNMEFNRFPGKIINNLSQEVIRARCDDWMSRQFQSNGLGSPFPLKRRGIADQRHVDIWGQMNAYSAEHFQ